MYKRQGVSFVIIRIGYRGYGAAGNLVKDPMFEEHFTNCLLYTSAAAAGRVCPGTSKKAGNGRNRAG